MYGVLLARLLLDATGEMEGLFRDDIRRFLLSIIPISLHTLEQQRLVINELSDLFLFHRITQVRLMLEWEDHLLLRYHLTFIVSHLVEVGRLQRILHRDAFPWVCTLHFSLSSTERQHLLQQFNRFCWRGRHQLLERLCLYRLQVQQKLPFSALYIPYFFHRPFIHFFNVC